MGNPWEESPPGDDGTSDPGALRADYSAWRERMRQKAQRNRSITEPAGDEPASSASYWDPARLFEGPDPLRSPRQEHLAVLDLRDGATPDDIAAAYRNLAKLHHPDRWASADADTQAHHEACMRAVNEAYHALRAEQRV